MIILLPEIIEEQRNDAAEFSYDYKKASHDVSPSITNQIFIENMTDIERKIGIKIDNTSILFKSDRKIEVVGEIYIKHPP